ncbi:MAG TPA: serine/threonine-protein kinase [Myxococcaceae bacterium]|nr:serine/threonine-protein kinase [Myxococcaceae bacterium]
MLDYEVLKKVAESSAAEAFVVRQKSSDERVILEILRPEVKSDSELSALFFQEAEALQELDHPNLIRRAATGRTSDGRLFAVTAPVAGESLSATLWSRGSLGVKEVIQLAIPLCDALDYLHRTGRVHGGVKPDLVYLSTQPQSSHPKLLDYHLALFQDGQTRRVGNAIFQPEYQSPESNGGQDIDQRSDIYGMGILIYEALTGFPPFTGADPYEVSRKQRTAPLSLPTSCERLATILQRCLHPDRQGRFATAMELKQALAREAEGDLEAPGNSLLSHVPLNLHNPTNLEERLASIGPFGDPLQRQAPLDLDQRLQRIGAFREIADSPGKTQAQEEPAGRRKQARQRSRSRTYAALTLVVFAALGAGWVSRKRPALLFDRQRAARLESRGPSAAIHLEVTSEPQGALVTWADSGEPLGTTPISTSVPREQRSQTLRMQLPGYLPASRKIQLDADARAHAKLRAVPLGANRRNLAHGKHSQRAERDRSLGPSER